MRFNNIAAPRGGLLQLPLWVELAPALVTLCAWSAPAALAETVVWKRSYFYEKFYTTNYLTTNPHRLRMAHRIWSSLQRASINKFWFDFSINSCTRVLLRMSYFFVFKCVDKGILEYSIIHFITNATRLVSFFITELQQHLAFNVAVNLVIFNIVCCLIVVYF